MKGNWSEKFLIFLQWWSRDTECQPPRAVPCISHHKNMICFSTGIGADVVDVSGVTTSPAHGALKEEPVFFEMSPEQRERQR